MSTSDSAYSQSVEEPLECDSTHSASVLVTGQNRPVDIFMKLLDVGTTANPINSVNQPPSVPTEQTAHPPHIVYRELRSETKLSRKSWSADNPHNCTYDPPSQETEGYSDGEEGSADLCVYPPPPLCRTKSAPVNAATSETCPRMLRAPSTEEQFEQNEEVMRRFFDKNLVKLSEEDVAHLGMKLLDCIEYRELRSETKLSRGINCIPTLVSGMFRRWTRKKGWDADLYQVKCILKEMGNNCMCHSLDAYIKEQSETLS